MRRILLTGRYQIEPMADEIDFGRQAQAGLLDARSLLACYCALLYRRCGNYEEVARRTGLDRRTVRKHLMMQAARKSDA